MGCCSSTGGEVPLACGPATLSGRVDYLIISRIGQDLHIIDGDQMTPFQRDRRYHPVEMGSNGDIHDEIQILACHSLASNSDKGLVRA